MTAGSAALPTAPVPGDGGPRIYGVVDVVRPDRVAGWVIDRRDDRSALDVEVRREGRLVATVKAARPRRDLEKAGVGTGRYGFACTIEPPLEAGFEFTLAVTARAADGTVEPLRRPASAAPDPDRRLLERIFETVGRPAETGLRRRRRTSSGRSPSASTLPWRGSRRGFRRWRRRRRLSGTPGCACSWLWR